MTALTERPPVAVAPRTARPILVPLLMAAVLVVSVLVRLHSASALWLDEALSVNISRLPLHDLPEALRHDGSPPLYYLLLHGWIAMFGTGTTAVRSLSVVFSVASLPLAFLLGRRMGGATVGWIAVLLLGTSPFAVRYATETRMYSMVVALVLLGGWLLARALDRPSVGRLLGVALVSGALLLTHYWALYLLAVVGALLLVLSVRGERRAAARRCVMALVASGVLFLPWLPSFLYQARHTGTPWAAPPRPAAVFGTVSVWAGGTGTPWGGLLLLLLVGLAVVALFGRARDGALLMSTPVSRPAAALAIVSGATLVLGLVLAMVTSAGYAPRYSSAALAPFLVLTAMGAAALPKRACVVLVTLAVVAGLGGSVLQPLSHRRTEAALLARALRAGLAPGDLVVYCPDQTGPAVSRLLPVSTDQVVYPTMGRPERVDWVDYAQRNESASPSQFATQVLARTQHTIWMVSAGEHLTFGHACEDLDRLLARARGGRELVVPTHRRFAEWAQVTRYRPAVGAG